MASLEKIFEETFCNEWFPQRPVQVVGKICVIGGGVIGLTTALALRCSFGPSVDIQVIADDFETTTSSTAAGVWLPFMSEDDRTDRLARTTWDMLLKFFPRAEQLHGPQHLKLASCSSPIARCDAWTVSELADDSFSHVPSYVGKLEPLPLSSLPHPRFRCGVQWPSIVTQSHLILPLLLRLCNERNISLVRGRIQDASLFASKTDASFIVCCCGLGARQLLQDDAVVPVQGTVVRTNPSPELIRGRFIDGVYKDDSHHLYAYIIPRSDCTVLGGTGFPNRWSKEPDSEEVQGIIERCEELCPGVSKLPVQRVLTDLRPTRAKLALGVRPELSLHDGKRIWIDSYGYGGSGWTVHLGAALDVVNMIATKPSKL